MNVLEAKGIARDWVVTNARDWAGFRAAHLVGGITAMEDDAPFPATKDIDLHLIFDDDSAMVQQRGPIPNIMEAQVAGLAIEAGLKPVSEYESPAAILGNPELAFHFTVESSIYDPDGWLSDLSRAVIPQYADREWVDARMRHEMRGQERAFGLRPLAQELLGPSGELSMLGYSSTFLAGAFSVAALRSPKMGGRVFVTIREYLDEIDRLDLHERLLAIFGLDRMSLPEAQELLDETGRFFDLALMRKQRPHPFDHKLHAHLRPYLIDSCQRMIDEGFHRESAAWMLPFHLAATDILALDGTAMERGWAAKRQERFLEERRFGSSEMRDARFGEIMQLSTEIFVLCWTMIERNPAGHPATGAGGIARKGPAPTMLEPDDSMGVRLVTSHDAPLVRELMLIGFAQFRNALDPPSSAFQETDADVAAAIDRGGAAIAWSGATPVGSIRFEPEGTWLYISRLAVIPEARRRGLAQALMLAAEAEASRFGVNEAQLSMREVLPGNRALFEKLGYQVISVEPHPRNPAQNTLRLRKMLP